MTIDIIKSDCFKADLPETQSQNVAHCFDLYCGCFSLCSPGHAPSLPCTVAPARTLPYQDKSDNVCFSVHMHFVSNHFNHSSCFVQCQQKKKKRERADL